MEINEGKFLPDLERVTLSRALGKCGVCNEADRTYF